MTKEKTRHVYLSPSFALAAVEPVLPPTTSSLAIGNDANTFCSLFATSVHLDVIKTNNDNKSTTTDDVYQLHRRVPSRDRAANRADD